jgi:hypothetical protein
MNQIATREPDRTTVREQSPLLVPDVFTAMFRLAEVMAAATTIPEAFHEKPGDCLRVVELAHRCGQSPFALIDHCFITGGRFGMDGQGMASLINASSRIAGSLRYQYSGEGRDRSVTVRGRLLGEAEERTVVATIAQGLRDSKGARARWEADPDQMLAYYGARRWARRHAPEVAMGLYTRDELRAAFDGKGPVLDVMPDEEPQAEAAPAGEARQPSGPWAVKDDHGQEQHIAATLDDALRRYGEVKAARSDKLAVAVNNLGLLRTAAAIAPDGLRRKIENEIEAAEAYLAEDELAAQAEGGEPGPGPQT